MNKIDLNKVPASFRRRAFQHLESMRTSLAVRSEKTLLANSVTPIMRPDIKDVAYYEFEIISTDGKSTGFIMLSTGPHDFPIPHFSFERIPVSQELEIAAKQNKAKLARIMKIDALCYVGENDAGDLIGQTGQIPPLLRGWPTNKSEFNKSLVFSIAHPPKNILDDGKIGKEKHVMRSSPTRKSILEIIEFKDWMHYKKNYTASFAPLIQNLQKNASHDWQIQNLLEEFGEGIYTGSSQNIALLEPQDSVKLSGDGAQYVKTSQPQRKDLPPVMLLQVKDIDLSHETDFKMHIKYKSGLEEVLPFFLVSKNTPTNARSFSYFDVPEIGLSASQMASFSERESVDIKGEPN